MGVPQEDVVDAAGSDELYLGFVWNGFRKGLTAFSFSVLAAINLFPTMLDGVRFQVSVFLTVLVVIISTGKTYHFDVKSDLFRYHQTFMLLSLSWIEVGRVSQIRVANFVTIENIVHDDSGKPHVNTYEVLHVVFENGEPFHFVSIFGRKHLEKIKSKINRFLFVNRADQINMKHHSRTVSRSEDSQNQLDGLPTHNNSEANETSTFW